MTKIAFENENGLNFLLDQSNFTAQLTFSPKAKGEIFIPKYVEYQSSQYYIATIESYAFHHNLSIESLKFALDSSVHQICENSFIDSSIVSLSIPKSLTNLDDRWCFGAMRLSRIEVDERNENFIFVEDKFLIKTDKNKNYEDLIFTIRNVEGDIEIPNGIKRFSETSFNNCTKLESISSFSKSSSLIEICKSAFIGCRNLKKIAPLPASLKKVGNECFENLEKLKSLEFLSEEISFGALCFWECLSLLCISFPYAKMIEINKISLNGVSKNFALFIHSGAKLV